MQYLRTYFSFQKYSIEILETFQKYSTTQKVLQIWICTHFFEYTVWLFIGFVILTVALDSTWILKLAKCYNQFTDLNCTQWHFISVCHIFLWLLLISTFIHSSVFMSLQTVKNITIYIINLRMLVWHHSKMWWEWEWLRRWFRMVFNGGNNRVVEKSFSHLAVLKELHSRNKQNKAFLT